MLCLQLQSLEDSLTLHNFSNRENDSHYSILCILVLVVAIPIICFQHKCINIYFLQDVLLNLNSRKVFQDHFY